MYDLVLLAHGSWILMLQKHPVTMLPQSAVVRLLQEHDWQ